MGGEILLCEWVSVQVSFLPCYVIQFLSHLGKMPYMEDTKNDNTIRILGIPGHADNAEGGLCS